MDVDPVTKEQTWKFVDGIGADLRLTSLTPDSGPKKGDQVRVVTFTITVASNDINGFTQVWDGISPDPDHQQAGSPDGLTKKFGARPSNLQQARSLPIVITLGENIDDGLKVLQAIFNSQPMLRAAIDKRGASDAERSIDIDLQGGNDGMRPRAGEYEGNEDPNTTTKTGLKSFEDLEDISTVAAPGSTYGLANGYRSDGSQIINNLISHATRMRYRIAVLDSGDGQSISAVRTLRGNIESSYAALYYPWVRILDPVTCEEIHLPPSGFVAGIYARNDAHRGGYRAPANEVVNLAIGFEQLLNETEQHVLTSEGINYFRYFEGLGFRLWGARTISSDPEWKYVNLRRYFAYLERSIEKGTQWAVFEPNSEVLWANIRRTIEDFLHNEWMRGALLGDRPDKAYFVKCDRSTMTQNDLDNGRLICLIGVAALKPTEFVIFRIEQWTADRKS